MLLLCALVAAVLMLNGAHPLSYSLYTTDSTSYEKGKVLAVYLFFVLAFLLSALYRGWSPVWVSVLTVLVVAFFSMVLINGLNRKTYTALAAVLVGCFFLLPLTQR
jgi:hypothetical protein